MRSWQSSAAVIVEISSSLMAKSPASVDKTSTVMGVVSGFSSCQKTAPLLPLKVLPKCQLAKIGGGTFRPAAASLAPWNYLGGGYQLASRLLRPRKHEYLPPVRILDVVDAQIGQSAQQRRDRNFPFKTSELRPNAVMDVKLTVHAKPIVKRVFGPTDCALRAVGQAFGCLKRSLRLPD
jgi:hypothetical protein